jgi:hypothetical protein
VRPAFPAGYKRRNKYGISPRAERTLNGVVFASRGEMMRWMELSLMKRAGLIVKLCRQVPYPLAVNGHHVCTYVADFWYWLRDGSEVVEDWKPGVRTPEYLLKKRLMKAINNIDILETGRKETPMPKQYEDIKNSELKSGKPLKEAERIGAATYNKQHPGNPMGPDREPTDDSSTEAAPSMPFGVGPQPRGRKKR